MRSLRVKLPIAAYAAIACALALPACSPYRSSIDPTGQRVFTNDGPRREEPRDRPLFPGTDSICITPNPVVAPVGSEVLLLATVRGEDQYLRTNERVEWSIAPGGVGYFTGVGHNGISDYIFGVPQRGRYSNTFVVGTTLRSPLRLTRGTADPNDDIDVQSGQAWVALMSPVEGTSHVTGVIPDGVSWDRNKHTVAVHWLDANWQFPSPGIGPAGGRHVLTTAVVRHSDRSPVTGWHVRYEIQDGPEAGFAPNGVRSVEVDTNSQGQASVEIMQPKPAGGTNRIQIVITRPGALPGAGGRPFTIAAGSTLMTWTQPQIAVRITGPAQSLVGANVRYQIAVSNPGDMPADEVTVQVPTPQGMSYVSGQPATESKAGKLEWRMGRLAGREVRNIELVLRADSAAAASVCAEVSAAGGLRARDCASTTASVSASPVTGPAVGSGTLTLRLAGPQKAELQSDLRMEIHLSNPTALPITDLLIRDRLDAGLQFPKDGGNIVERVLARLEPGESKQINVPLRAVKLGRQCHTVEVRQGAKVLATETGCIEVVAATPTGVPPATDTPGATGPPPNKPDSYPPIAPPDGAAGVKPPGMLSPDARAVDRDALKIEINMPKATSVGSSVTCAITVRNTGKQSFTGVQVDTKYDAELVPEQATEGFEATRSGVSWKCGDLQPGGEVKVKVQYRCERASKQSCARATVTSREGSFAQAQGCLEISEAAPSTAPSSTGVSPATPNKLTLTLSDLQDPVTKGKEVTYLITITNAGPAPEKQVVLTVTLPDALMPVPIGTESTKSRVSILGQTVRFEPLPELGVDQTETYYVRVRAQQAGVHKARAEVTGQSVVTPVTAEEATQVF